MAIIDLVRWEPGSDQVYAWKFPHSNLSTYTQLIVSESQEAILFSKGQILGKFGPGKHTLNTENLPIIRGLFGIPFGGKNPFTAEVWFVNKLLPLNIDWETDSMMYHDPQYNTMVPLISKGRYGVKITDAEKFLVKLVGTSTAFNSAQLTDNFWGVTVSKTKSVLLQFMMSNQIGLKTVSAYLDPLSENLKLAMRPFWEDYGFDLVAFYITSIEVDATKEAGARILDAMGRQSAQSIGGYTWQQQQAFDVADKAVDSMGNSQGGMLGAIMATNMMNNFSGQGMMQQPVNNQQANPEVLNNVTGINTPKIIFCSNCSKKYANNMKFCPHCGDPYTGCPKCGSDNDVNAKKCVSCGIGLSSTISACANCNTAIPDGSAFCPSCGKPQSVNPDNCQRCGTALNNNKFCPQCGLKKN